MRTVEAMTSDDCALNVSASSFRSSAARANARRLRPETGVFSAKLLGVGESRNLAQNRTSSGHAMPVIIHNS